MNSKDQSIKKEILDSFDDDQKIIKYAENGFSVFASSYIDNYVRGIRTRSFISTEQGPWEGVGLDVRQQQARRSMNVNVITIRQRALMAEYFANNPIPQFTTLGEVNSSDYIEFNENLFNTAYHKREGKFASECMLQNSSGLGWGAICLSVKPNESDPFENDICFTPIKDAITTFWDVLAPDKHKIMGMYAGNIELWPADVFAATFPGENVESAAFPIPSIDINYSENSYITLSSSILGDRNNHSIPLCRFNYKVPYETKMIQFTLNGRKECLEEELFEKLVEDTKNSGYEIKKLQEKKVIKYKTRVALLSKNSVLESTEFKTDFLFQYFCPGSVDVVSGFKEVTCPYLYCALAAQVMLNMAAGDVVDSMSRSYGARMVASDNAVLDKKAEYANPKNQGLLTWNPVNPETGEMSTIGKPELLIAPSFDANLLNLINESIKLIEVCIGQSSYDLAHSPVEASGIAILQKQIHGNLSLGVYPSNANSTLSAVAEGFLKLIPLVYDTEREVEVTTKSGKTSKVRINQFVPGENYLRNDIQRFSSNVVSSTMMSSLSQDMSFLRFAFDLMQVDPQNLGHVFLDIVSDAAAKIYPTSHEVSERLRLSGYIDKNLVKDRDLKKEIERNPGDFEKIKQGQQEQAEHAKKIQELEMALKVGAVLIQQKNAREEMKLQKVKLYSEILKNFSSINNEEKQNLMNTVLDIMKIEGQRESNLASNLTALSKELSAMASMESNSEEAKVSEEAIKSTTESIKNTI